MADADELEIGSLGAQGEGVAARGQERLFIPYALPGERWRLRAGAPADLVRPRPDRAAPLCRHFGSCGGCLAQHMPAALYADWKRGIVVDAFRHRGIDAPVGELVPVLPGSRRRLALCARRSSDGLRLGFHRAGAHDIVDIGECPIALPELVAALPVLRQMLEPVLAGRAEATVHMLATRAGIDVSLVFAHLESPRRHYPRLAALAARAGFARLAVGGEAVMLGREPVLELGGVQVVPPPGAFVQAVEASEAHMLRLALEATAGARRIADLFCGLGTFTLPLARRARLLAVDSDGEAVAALAAAARRARHLQPIETRVRDLYRMPLSPKELEDFDAVVLDPSRAGARAQAEELARSPVPTVVAVSCSPGTLARDARILHDGGYALEAVTPIDQFLFSAHVEAVAVFRRQSRPSQGRKRPTRRAYATKSSP